ncbi:DNA-binding transcriptional LysR family regulator [Herbaspirillum sp. Sphag1AN]|uniref:LysR family transcriptional regulator n=1 Tax=unclassified Herbaspirillum TaxID=2624150 RepID=UPI001607279F|nr:MULTISPECIES: LysR family transcriptional regulator [unclassified Herbaspirillum]MBB3211965.1 DNA-binding transcriptional LysR family regulator [Herbaspirillum sp. Sphag1AN]MBB3244201.1 DNA-binding transcriptional LysR family regulator [Herbaspirillum sp. Sphag64]
MDKLSAMRTFVRVVESGSFSAVADESQTTQSAVSKQVAALERQLGAKLLIRTTRSLALTEEGARYFEQARRLVAEIAEAESDLITGERQLRGWIRVAASVGFGRLKLMPLVKSFMQAHPDVKVDLRLHDGFIDLVEQGIDVSVRIGDLPDSGLIARRVGVSQRMLLAHRDYLRNLPADVRAPRDPEDLPAHQCIVYTGLANSNLWTFTAGAGASETMGVTKSVRVHGGIQTNSSEVIRSAVIGAMGIGYAPTWLFEPELANGEVVRLMPDWDSPLSPIHLVSPPERKHSAKVKAFVEHISLALH